MIGAEEVQVDDGVEQLRTDVEELKEEIKALKERNLVLESSSQQKKTTTAKNHAINHKCSKQVYEVYKKLLKNADFRGFSFEEGFYSDGNKSIARKLRREVRGLKTDEKWTRDTIKASIHQYWKSLRDDFTRRKNSKFQEHRINLRKQQRSKRKLQRRRKALLCTELSPADQEKAKQILEASYALECMSSEESCEDTDREPGPGPKPRKIRRLQWERSKLYNIKKALDDHTKNNLTAAQRRLSSRILISEEKSSRPKPNGVPSWAARD